MLILKKANIRVAVLLVLFLSTEFGLGPGPAEAEDSTPPPSTKPPSSADGSDTLECYTCAKGKDCLSKPGDQGTEMCGKCVTIFYRKAGKYVQAERGCFEKMITNATCDLAKDDCKKGEAAKLHQCKPATETKPTVEPPTDPNPPTDPKPPTDPQPTTDPNPGDTPPEEAKAGEEPDMVEVCACDRDKCNSVVKGGVSGISEIKALILLAIATFVALAP